MDNVSVHKVTGIQEAIEARGNPIEQVFAKLKAILRKNCSLYPQERGILYQTPLQGHRLLS